MSINDLILSYFHLSIRYPNLANYSTGKALSFAFPSHGNARLSAGAWDAKLFVLIELINLAAYTDANYTLVLGVRENSPVNN